MSRRFKIKNCCENCVYATNYTGYDDFDCSQLDRMIRAEKFDCDYFKPKKMSKITNDTDMNRTEAIMQKVDNMSATIKELSDNLVRKYCKDLNILMLNIQGFIKANNITDEFLETAILDLANILYFTGSAQEDLGIKEDICKAIRQEVYSKAREQATGKTVADKTAQAELIAQAETMTLAIYSRSYKKVKLRMDAGYEMLNSLKKVMNKRITEMELSNSRYINNSKGAMKNE